MKKRIYVYLETTSGIYKLARVVRNANGTIFGNFFEPLPIEIAGTKLLDIHFSYIVDKGDYHITSILENGKKLRVRRNSVEGSEINAPESFIVKILTGLVQSYSPDLNEFKSDKNIGFTIITMTTDNITQFMSPEKPIPKRNSSDFWINEEELKLSNGNIVGRLLGKACNPMYENFYSIKVENSTEPYIFIGLC